jgi:hypothetical protein
MVDENDTGVRNALAVTPVRPTTLILTRTVVAAAWLCVWPALTMTIMNAAWQAIDLPLLQWAALILSLALLTPALALAIPVLASDKVEALAVFKGLTFVTLAPLAMYFVTADAWYRYLFLLSPTAWAVQALETFLDGSTAGYLWAGGGGAYALLLLAGAIHFFRRSVYKLST